MKKTILEDVNVQQQFLTLMDDTIRQRSLRQLVVNYNTAIYNTKVRLNYAVCLGGMLLAENMVKNTTTVAGYNNDEKTADSSYNLGANNQVNKDMKKGKNANVKEEITAQPETAPQTQTSSSTTPQSTSTTSQSTTPPLTTTTTGGGSENHEYSKIAFIVGALAIAVVAYLVIAR